MPGSGGRAALMSPRWRTERTWAGRRDLCGGCWGSGSGRLGAPACPCSVGMGPSDRTQELGSALFPSLDLGPCLQVRHHLGRCPQQPWAWGVAGRLPGHLLLQEAQHLVLRRSRCHSFCASGQAPRLAPSCRTAFLLFYFYLGQNVLLDGLRPKQEAVWGDHGLVARLPTEAAAAEALAGILAPGNVLGSVAGSHRDPLLLMVSAAAGLAVPVTLTNTPGSLAASAACPPPPGSPGWRFHATSSPILFLFYLFLILKVGGLYDK